MNKIPRFMNEYAKYQIDTMAENDIMADEPKVKATNKICKAQKLYECGLITVNEAMKMICDCFAD